MFVRPSNHLFASLAFVLTGGFAVNAGATDAKSDLPQPITLASRVTMQDDELPNVGSGDVASPSKDLPASIANPSGILPLATSGAFVFEPLPTRGSCAFIPDVRCIGPDYHGCTPRIYYGTNPCDDDPVLSMSPTVCDPKTQHWYTKAWKMILRKKAITEAIKN